LDRDETSVPIHLSELGAISTATATAAFWWSVATFFGGSSLSLYLAGLGISAPTAYQIALTQFTPIVSAAFAAVCIVAAIRDTLRRNSLVHQIERECGVNRAPLPQRVARWLGSWRRQENVQAKNNALLLSPLPGIPLKDASPLPGNEAPRVEAPQSKV
jgi:hypothetical protein